MKTSFKMVDQLLVKFSVFASIGELQIIPEPIIQLDFQLCELNLKYLSDNVEMKLSADTD